MDLRPGDSEWKGSPGFNRGGNQFQSGTEDEPCCSSVRPLKVCGLLRVTKVFYVLLILPAGGINEFSIEHSGQIHRDCPGTRVAFRVVYRDLHLHAAKIQPVEALRDFS